jgi:hypothetical protein
MVVCRGVRSARLGRFGWPLALALAFASHFLLDSIPHLDAMGPLRSFRSSWLLFPAFGVTAAALTWLVYRRNPGLAWIWILLSLWLVISGFSGTILRGLAALVLVGLLFYRTRRADSPGYLLAGILAISADFVPKTVSTLANFHNGLHYNVGWGTSLFLQFQDPPLPSGLVRLQNPYYLMGYGLEFLVEAVFFLLAFVSLSRLALDPKPAAEEAISSSQPEETSVPV